MKFSHYSGLRLWRTGVLFSTKSKCHKSNFRTSGIYRYPHHNLKAVFSWPPRSSKWCKSIRKTLYTYGELRIFLTNLTKFLTNILTKFDFSVDFSLTYNLLTVASFRIGVPSILFFPSIIFFLFQFMQLFSADAKISFKKMSKFFLPPKT